MENGISPAPEVASGQVGLANTVSAAKAPDMIRVGLGLGTTWLGIVNYYRNLIAAVMSLENRRIEPVLLATHTVDDRVLQGFPATEVVRSPWLDDGTPRWVLRKLWQQAFGCDPFLERVARSNRID